MLVIFLHTNDQKEAALKKAAPFEIIMKTAITGQTLH